MILCSYELILIITIFAAVSLFGTVLYGMMYLDRQAMNWETVKPDVEGQLKDDLMKHYSLSEYEYMQSIVGIWVLANIPAEDVKELMKLSENSKNERKTVKKIIYKVKRIQKEMRLLFLLQIKTVEDPWKSPFLSSLIMLLKNSPSKIPLNTIERRVASDFYKKHENAAVILNKKIINGDLTFTENAIKYVSNAFQQALKSTS
jgi:hypothetical protein